MNLKTIWQKVKSFLPKPHRCPIDGQRMIEVMPTLWQCPKCGFEFSPGKPPAGELPNKGDHRGEI